MKPSPKLLWLAAFLMDHGILKSGDALRMAREILRRLEPKRRKR